MVPSLPLLSCELSVSAKENPNRKKNCLSVVQFLRKIIDYLSVECGLLFAEAAIRDVFDVLE